MTPLILRFHTHPSAARPLATAGVMAAMLAFAVLTGPWLAGAGLLSAKGALGFLVVWLGLALALGRWFFPSTYVVDDEGITAVFLASRRRYPWTRFRSWRVERGGVYLSPLANPARFDRFRGLFMLVDESTHAAAAGDARAILTGILEDKLGGYRKTSGSLSEKWGRLPTSSGNRSQIP